MHAPSQQSSSTSQGPYASLQKGPVSSSSSPESDVVLPPVGPVDPVTMPPVPVVSPPPEPVICGAVFFCPVDSDPSVPGSVVLEELEALAIVVEPSISRGEVAPSGAQPASATSKSRFMQWFVLLS